MSNEIKNDEIQYPLGDTPEETGPEHSAIPDVAEVEVIEYGDGE